MRYPIKTITIINTIPLSSLPRRSNISSEAIQQRIHINILPEKPQTKDFFITFITRKSIVPIRIERIKNNTPIAASF
jgi:hypothetical protein